VSIRLTHLLLVCWSVAGAALAQPVGGPGASTPPAEVHALPAMTAVSLRLGAEISSNRNRPGDRFTIYIAEDVRVGDVTVIPAGSQGEGEVVHAQKSGAGGKAGELILAARFVLVGGREVRLRSFAAGVGKDRSGKTIGLTAVAVAATPYAAPLAFFIRGGVLVMPEGMIAAAKTAQEVQLPAWLPPAPPGSPQEFDTTNEGAKEE
jgi:hypothetical protein